MASNRKPSMFPKATDQNPLLWKNESDWLLQVERTSFISLGFCSYHAVGLFWASMMHQGNPDICNCIVCMYVCIFHGKGLQTIENFSWRLTYCFSLSPLRYQRKVIEGCTDIYLYLCSLIQPYIFFCNPRGPLQLL